MKKILLSSFILLLFALLAGGSFEGFGESLLLTIGLFALGFLIYYALGLIRNRQIEKSEAKLGDISSLNNFGNNKCRFYFDAAKKQVLIMRFRLSGVQKEYVDGFEYGSEQLCLQKDPCFCIYDSKNRQMLTGSYKEENLDYEVKKIEQKIPMPHSSIVPKLAVVQSSMDSLFSSTKITTFALIDENQGFIALSRNGRLDETFYYVDDASAKTGSQSFVVDKSIGNYLFIMDDFFHKLVIVTPETYEIFNYTDIIEISYEEDGTALFTKSAARTVGGALVGGALLGKAGAVIGGLSGSSAQHKEVNSMQIKILLRNAEKTTYVLNFKQRSSTLKTSSDLDADYYKMFLKDAMAAKDLLSVIIDKAQQLSLASQQPVAEKASDFSVADELSKLARLKKDGFLTDEEFEAQKKKLLES